MIPEALPNASEYFKENVAVVTNPAIDREREADHFSTKTILGDRPDSKGLQKPSAVGLELSSPVLLGGGVEDVVPVEVSRRIAEKYGTFILEDVLSFFTADGKDISRVHTLDATFEPAGCLKERMNALCDEAVEAVKNGAVILLVDDSRSFDGEKVFVDPGLAATTLVKRLDAEGIRRKCSLIVRSAAVRNLHDVMFLLGLGIDAVNPYLMQRVTADFSDEKREVEKLVGGIMDILQKGMEKVMSTMGIHELCGYGRIFASIGLTKRMAEIFQCPNFCASESTGLSYKRLVALAKMRQERIRSDKNAPLWKDKPRNVRVGKVLRAASLGESGWKAMAEGMAEIDSAIPNAVRHMLTIKNVDPEERTPLERVDISVKGHDIPVTIPAMSFGSQGENSFRSYAEAAKRANIVCINGEGGEIPDMLGKYRKNRGQQIASGRFGVFMGFLNSADFLEIKIGQGAKPGEGGHLPGAKVSEMVARARHCKPGIPLISPSNHHDIYSIEDLQQIITELKTANPLARISVKIPVTSGVGTIAVGIAKAGADIVSVSGFDGGTGAAREHAKKYTGLPAEIGVAYAHRALAESGLRHKVEIWADGGCRSGEDVVKMILLGADRVGLGTLSLMGVGCVSCHRCHLDRCPRGISTQLRDVKDAESKGVVNFRLVEHEEETANLTRLLMSLGESIRMIVSHMGETSLADLVGRTDLLEQTRYMEELDVSELLQKPCGDEDCEYAPYRTIARKPLNYLTKLISDMSMEQFQAGHSEVNFADDEIKSTDRAVGTYLAGAISRAYGNENKAAQLRLSSSIPGNGLGAFNTIGIDIDVAGGSQDGTAKSSFGGTVKVLKGVNLLGRPVDGSTGKSFAYGAIGGTLIIQNYADSRACVRMSGADVVFGARITEPIRDEEGNIASRSHLKGFAFEYMTGGRVVVLGDPGPWICSGMTGGIVYQCLYPEFGFTKDSITRRLATGADVVLKNMDTEGMDGLKKLLSSYIWELNNSWQAEEAEAVGKLLADADKRFVMIVPRPKSPPRPE
jgi:glutamate synthase (NADPH/NADH) large chain